VIICLLQLRGSNLCHWSWLTDLPLIKNAHKIKVLSGFIVINHTEHNEFEVPFIKNAHKIKVCKHLMVDKPIIDQISISRTLYKHCSGRNEDQNILQMNDAKHAKQPS
jgi:hypothetical protein